jgi:CRISPR-associated protein Csd2
MAENLLPQFIRDNYQIIDYRHAIAILATEFPDLFTDICEVLQQVRITRTMIMEAGGSESQIPREFSRHLRPRGWIESEFTAKVIINDVEEVRTETHKIDYVKGRVAFDLEWNSKDQTFDRDLYAFRGFFDYNRISVGVLVTRSSELQQYFTTLGTYEDTHHVVRQISAKYGASTTHMDKLISRLKQGRSGGCPVFALGIRTSLIVKVE